MESTVSVDFQERAFKILLSLPENQLCADCPASCPDWASLNLGVFVCYKCSGVHRALGLHITRIKSVKLDSWTLKQMFMMCSVNNQETSRYWEAKRPDHKTRPHHDSPQLELRNFIYSKYVHKEWIEPGTRPPFEDVIANLNVEVERSKQENKEVYFQKKLKELEEILNSKLEMIIDQKIKPFGSGTKDEKQKMFKSNSPVKKFQENQPVNPRLFQSSGFMNQRFNSNPDSELNRTHSTQPTTQDDERKDSKPNFPMENLSLFEGLKVKSISPPPRKPFMRLNSLELDGAPEPHFSQRLPSFTPKSKPQNLFNFSSIEKSPMHAKSPGFFGAASLKESLKSLDHIGNNAVELSDMSQKSSKNHLGEKSKKNKDKTSGRSSSFGFRDEKEFKSHELQLKLAAPNSTSSLDVPFFTNLSPGKMAQQGLKRPSDEFEMYKLETPMSRPKKARNLIRPSGGYPKFVVLFGALLLHFSFGYIYSWGSISVYLAFFFKEDYQESYYLDVASYSTLIFLAITLGYTFTENLVNSFGFRKTSSLCFISLFLMLMICSLTITPVLYSIIPTFVVGFFLGLAYHIPFYCSVQYFPRGSTMLKVLFYFFDSLGACYFACWSYMYLDLHQAEITPENDDYYPDNISNNIPGMIRYIGIQLFVLGIIGSLTMKPRFNFVEKDWSALRDKEEVLLKSRNSVVASKRKGGKTLFRDLKHALMSPISRNLFQIVVFSSILGTYYLCSYKIVGLQLGYSDSSLTLIGSAGMIIMSLGKILALFVHRKIQFRRCMKYLIILQALLGIFATATYDSFMPYFLPIMLINGFMNAFVIEEVVVAFSDEMECPMVAVMMVGITVSNFTGFTIVKVGEYVMSHKYLNLILIVPLIWAFLINRKYAGREYKDHYSSSSVAEMEVERILAD